jgi:hypothetical protein
MSMHAPIVSGLRPPGNLLEGPLTAPFLPGTPQIKVQLIILFLAEFVHTKFFARCKPKQNIDNGRIFFSDK